MSQEQLCALADQVVHFALSVNISFNDLSDKELTKLQYLCNATASLPKRTMTTTTM